MSDSVTLSHYNTVIPGSFSSNLSPPVFRSSPALTHHTSSEYSEKNDVTFVSLFCRSPQSTSSKDDDASPNPFKYDEVGFCKINKIVETYRYCAIKFVFIAFENCSIVIRKGICFIKF